MSVESLLRKRRRWMLFVDGENFTLQGQKILSSHNLTLNDDDNHRQDAFLWKPGSNPKSDSWIPYAIGGAMLGHAERAFYYTTVTGSNEVREDVRQRLWNLGFHPEVFQKPKGAKAKGVDITFTKDVLCHAFQDNYDVAVLMAGDGDYVPLVSEIKRLGKIVCVCFFASSGLSPELRLAADHFLDQTDELVRTWQLRAKST